MKILKVRKEAGVERILKIIMVCLDEEFRQGIWAFLGFINPHGP